MTQYTLDCDDGLWEEYKETFPRRLTVNEGLVRHLALITRKTRGDELPDDVDSTIDDILGDITWENTFGCEDGGKGGSDGITSGECE